MTDRPTTEESGMRLALWPGTMMPGKRGAALEDRPVPAGAIGRVETPLIEVRRPVRPNGGAVLILGGGGYRHIQMAREGDPAADLALSLGLTAILLHHRLPIDGWAPEAALQDVQRAMRVIRHHAADWAIDPARLGVIGFSAGGHLAAMLATCFDRETYRADDAADALSARPDFAVLLFPVISLLAPYDTTATRRMLSGSTTDADLPKSYSPHLLVTPQTPPTFLAHAADDQVAPPDHSILMFQALKAAGVAAELHVFQSGGHGHADGAPNTRFHLWQGLFSSWVAPWTGPN
ncbi:alpha/beta hydrolase [Rhizobium halophytocola]|uniref:Acetyl esterase/lipase n=1 Tax=Rhizobium halophytocola TaxID=735519 RepID=A0ABS4DUJ7_9HYPH|nr:alpha/beta hydrolase [Rhizobium halophytocola]MBP1849372.1 acetyl esterase/lipase [Rhizobium halophytocola]